MNQEHQHAKPPYSEQKLAKPGLEQQMEQKPRWQAPHYRAAQKLQGKVALITGGDSGIGRSVAYLYAREGADIAITYLAAEEADALVTQQAIEKEGGKCLLLAGDLTHPSFCREVVEQTINEFGHLDILVSNAAFQKRHHDVNDITEEEWHHTFKTNIDAYFFLVQAALKYMKAGSSIIATSSQTAIVGSENLLDYSATKGAIIAFTKSLATKLASKGIRVNSVAPGPVWTPLNPADEGLDPEKLKNFGGKQPMQRAAQPEEIAPAYVFLASQADSSYISGIVIEEMGGLSASA